MLNTSCNRDVLSGKPGSSGKTLELMVVANNAVYNNNTKMILDSLFACPQEVLNQPEPLFDVVRLSPNQFNGNTMFQAHRNILMLEVSSENANKAYLEYDKWSQPQVVMRVAARTEADLDSLLFVMYPRMLRELYDSEYRRMAKVFAGMPNDEVNRKVNAKYGVNLLFPKEFV